MNRCFSMMRKTCYGCDCLMIEKAGFGLVAAVCIDTKNVVPQYMDSASQTITFHRIPMGCHLCNSLVEKNTKSIPKKQWITKTFTELGIND